MSNAGKYEDLHQLAVGVSAHTPNYMEQLQVLTYPAHEHVRLVPPLWSHTEVVARILHDLVPSCLHNFNCHMSASYLR